MHVRSSWSALLLCVAFGATASGQWSKDPLVNLRLSDGNGEEVQAKLRAGPAGGAWVSLFDSDPSGSPAFGYDVRIQRLNAAGVAALAPGGVLVADLGLSSTQDYGLAVGSDGSAFLAFQDDRLGGVRITATRVLPDGSQPWGSLGVGLTSTSSGPNSPRIAATTDDGVVVGWSQGNNVRLRRLNLNGSPQWGADVVLTLPANTTAFLADLQTSDNGCVVFSYVRQTGGFFGPRNLYAQKLDPSGSALWNPAGVPILTTNSLQIGNFPRFVSDGQGGAYFTCYGTGPLQSYAQHVLASGSPAYGAAPVEVATGGTNLRVQPEIDFDPQTGEAYVFWKETNASQSLSGLGGQRLSPLGARLWGSAGLLFVPLGNSSVNQLVAGVSAPGRPLAIWSSGGFGSENLRALQADQNGSLLHPVVTLAASPAAIDDLDGRAGPFGDWRLVWHDNRTGDNDVYIQTLTAGGAAAPPAGALAISAPNNIPSYSATVGVLGASLQLAVNLSLAGHAFAASFTTLNSASLPFGNQTILIDLFGGGDLLGLPAQIGPLASWTVPIPLNPNLCGLVLYSQALHADFSLPFSLSNGQELHLGL